MYQRTLKRLINAITRPLASSRLWVLVSVACPLCTNSSTIWRMCTMLRLISSVTALCCSAAVAICVLRLLIWLTGWRVKGVLETVPLSTEIKSVTFPKRFTHFFEQTVLSEGFWINGAWWRGGVVIEVKRFCIAGQANDLVF